MMNKRLITLAVAAALVAPTAAMADAILYGKLHVSVDYADVTNAIAPTYGFDRDANGDVILDNDGNPTLVVTHPGVDFKGWGVNKGNGYIPGESRANRIGVKGSEDLGNGLKAIYQVELGVSLRDTNNNLGSGADSITMRNSFVGLAGDWGTFLVGRHDTPLKISTGPLDLFADTMADYNGTVGFQDIRADNAIAYISPSWGGFQLALATVAGGGATVTGDRNINSDGINEAYSLAGIYKNGPFYASAAYEVLGNELYNDSFTSAHGTNCPYEFDNGDGTYDVACAYTDSDDTKWRLGLGILDWNGFTLTAIYEQEDSRFGSDEYVGIVDPANVSNNALLPDAASEVTRWQIQAGYAFGNNMVKAMYGQADYTGDYYVGGNWVAAAGGAQYLRNITDRYDGNLDTWAIAFDHNFSKRTKAYAVYTDVTNDQSDIVAGSQWSGFSVGMIHNF
jgi:predicted porin